MELEASLYDVTSATWGKTEKEAAKSYDILKAYLMVTEPRRLKRDFALPVLVGEWKKRLHPEVAKNEDLLQRNAGRYLGLLQAGLARWGERDEQLVKQVRRALVSKDVEYKRIVGTLEQTLVPFSLRDALQGRIQTVFTDSYKGPGVYTRMGWEKHIKPRISKSTADGTQIEPWVLGEDEDADPAQLLRERYFTAYNEAWQRFFKGISLKEPNDGREALSMLEGLTSTPPFHEALLRAVAYNTDFTEQAPGANLEQVEGMVRGRTGRALRNVRRLGLDKAAMERMGDRPLNAVEREWQPVRRLVIPPQGIDGAPQVSGVTEYTRRLEKVREELTTFLTTQDNPDSSQLELAVSEANRITRVILGDVPSGLRSVLSPLFYAPLQGTMMNVKSTEKSIISERFRSGVCDPFNKKLAGRFPFARAEGDALMQDVTEAFSRQGSIWRYFEANLKEKLELRGEEYVVRAGKTVSPGIVYFINQAWAVTQALFPQGMSTPTFQFDVRPHPAIVAEGAGHMVSEITLELDGLARTYRNGPRDWWSFTWPGSASRGARLQLRGADGLDESIRLEGDWAFLRLLDLARVQRRGSWYLVEWSLKRGAIRVQMDFKPQRTDNPLLLRATTLRKGLSCQ